MAEGAPAVPTYPFLKGHGTENDFVLLPDPDGTVHGDLSADRVRALCDRRAGIGGDGVLRVVRSEYVDPEADAAGAEWFMDYRNSDGSVSEMCGNGVRVFARHLVAAGLAVPSADGLLIGTRDGIKRVAFAGDPATGEPTVDLGEPVVYGESPVSVHDSPTGRREWAATHVDMGNPHAVAFVDDLSEAGRLLDEPAYDHAVYPHGVNVEFVARRGPGHVAMRVHERGSGETRSCGTGAGAVAVAVALTDGATHGLAPDRNPTTPRDDSTYRVDVPGGTLTVTWTAAGRVLLTGPAEIVAEGTTAL